MVKWLACAEDEPPETDAWLSGRDRRRLAQMKYKKRYDEARLSRWTAQRGVVLALGMADTIENVAKVRMSNAADGSPRAQVDGFDELSVSSTDRAGWAVTTVLEGPEPIGCDLEIVEPRSKAFVSDYFTQNEQRLIAAEPLPADVLANLIWSAKESALKVLRTGLRRDTRTVDVNGEFGTSDEWMPLGITEASGLFFAGWWRRFGDFLLTFASESELPPPASLLEPPPLIGAKPDHSWMVEPIRGQFDGSSHDQM